MRCFVPNFTVISRSRPKKSSLAPFPEGAKIILSLRALTQTSGRWAQFWEKIAQFGAECYC